MMDTTTMNSTIADATVDNAVRMYTDTLTGEQRTALEAALRNERSRFGVIDDTIDSDMFYMTAGSQCYLGHFSLVEFARRSVVDALTTVERIYIENAFDHDLDEGTTVFGAFYLFCKKYGVEYSNSDEWLYWDWFTILHAYNVDNRHDLHGTPSWFDGDDYNTKLHHLTELVHTVHDSDEADDSMRTACDMLLRLADDTRAISVYRMEALRAPVPEHIDDSIPTEFYGAVSEDDMVIPNNAAAIWGAGIEGPSTILFMSSDDATPSNWLSDIITIQSAAEAIGIPLPFSTRYESLYDVFVSTPTVWNKVMRAVINEYELYKYYNRFAWSSITTANDIINRANRMMVRKVEHYTDDPSEPYYLDPSWHKTRWAECEQQLGYTQCS